MKSLFKRAAIVLSATLLAACATSQPQDTKILLVHSAKIDCDAGAGATTCYQIKTVSSENSESEDENRSAADDYASQDWQLYYNDIKGFDFEPGYQYKIKVQESETAKNSDPARNVQDVSTREYTLVEVMEKKMQQGSELNDIWVLQTINGENIDDLISDQPIQAPNLEINLAHMRVYGSDSCNRYSGSFKLPEENQIELSQLVSTRKLCPDMTLASKYLQILTKINHYVVDNGVLTLSNSELQTSLIFKKVD